LAFRFGAPDVYLLKRNTTEMITDKLKALVKEEAEKLKIHATPEELERLDFKKLSPWFDNLCPYGQMTGSCYSPRAEELLNKCAHAYSIGLSEFAQANRKTFTEGSNRTHYSPIEFYIGLVHANPEALIDFLKGKSQTLNL